MIGSSPVSPIGYNKIPPHKQMRLELENRGSKNMMLL